MIKWTKLKIVIQKGNKNASSRMFQVSKNMEYKYHSAVLN